MGKKRARAEASAAAPAPTDKEWLIFRYQPVSLFSLRMTHATNKGGKTLVVPTPYSFKMALIDACFRAFDGETAKAQARALFETVKRSVVRFCPPKECVVQNTFVKIRQDAEAPDKKKGQPEAEYRSTVLSALQDLKPWVSPERWRESSVKDMKGEFKGLFRPTIAYREWVFYRGELSVAISAGGLSDEHRTLVRQSAAHINYLGKRGCFWQFLDAAVHPAPLPPGFTIPQGTVESLRPDLYGMSQFLDDFGESLCDARDGFERISTYHDKKISLGEHRVLIPTLIPYVRVQATRTFTHYRSNPIEAGT